jgi:cell fate regulator YaaT (PSP1 superfamily)
VPTIVGVKLRNPAKPVLFDIGSAEGLDIDDIVIVATDRGEELGRVASEPAEKTEGAFVDHANRVVRVATREDLEAAEDLNRREREAQPVYRRLVNKHKLDMKPTDVESRWTASARCSISSPRSGSTSATWSAIWLRSSIHASTCARSAFATRQG